MQYACNTWWVLRKFELVLSSIPERKWPETNHLGQRYSPDSNEGKLAGTLLADGVLRDSLVPCGRLRVHEFGSEAPSLCHDDNSWKDCRLSANWLSCNGNQQRPLEGFLWNLQQFVFSSSFNNWKSDAFLIFVIFWFCAKLRWASWPDRSTCVLAQKLPVMTAVATSYDWCMRSFLEQTWSSMALACGSCVMKCCQKQPLQNLQTCWQKILSVYKEKHIVERYRGMNKLSLFKRKSGGPKLKGKAAQVAALAEPMLSLWEQHMDHSL